MYQQQPGERKGTMLVLLLVAGMGMPCRGYSAQKLGLTPIAGVASQRTLAKASSGTMRGRLPLWVYYALAVLTHGPRSVFRLYEMHSRSMENTLHIHDRLLVDTLGLKLQPPHFQGLLAYDAPVRAIGGFAPGTPSPLPGEVVFLHRCIGVPGDVISLRNRKLFRNGRHIAEPYVKWSSVPEWSQGYDLKIVNGVLYSREHDAPDDPARGARLKPAFTSPPWSRIASAKPRRARFRPDAT